MGAPQDEPGLVAAILRGDPEGSRNRHYELLSSELGVRARRRAAFLRSLVRDLEATRRERGATVTISRGASSARGPVRVSIEHPHFRRRAYLTEDEVTLLARTFPLAGRVFGMDGAAVEE